MTNLTVPTSQPWLDTSTYPFRAHAFRHTDGAMHYVDEGSGAPLLFVHGTPSWSFEWRAAIAHFGSSHRCIAPDHLGFGLSEKPVTAGLLPRDHTRRLHDFITALDLRDVTLVVHDFGGPIALPLLLRDPSRFRRVVVVNTWAWPMDDNQGGQSLMRLVRSPLGRFLYLYCNASARWLVPTSFANRKRLTRDIHRHYLAPFPDRASRRGPWTLGANLVDSAAFAPELPDVIDALRAVPTSIIWGTGDRLIGPDVLAEWQRRLPEAALLTLDDSGHFPQEEEPDAFLAALEQVFAAMSPPQSNATSASAPLAGLTSSFGR